MSDWSTQPGLSQLWADFVAAIKDRDEANAKMDYTGQTNIPSGTIRWNTTSLQFESWDGTSWAVLSNVAQTSAVVPNTRTITAGTGLTGGGALSANRTLSLANMTAATVKGRASGAGTGAPTDLTAAQLVAIITAADGAGSGLDADNLDGRTWSESAAASTIASRNSSGQLLATYFNQNSPQENFTVGSVFAELAGDGYHRKISLGNFEAQIGTEGNSGSRVVRRTSAGHINVTNVNSAITDDDVTAIHGFIYHNNDGYMRRMTIARAKRNIFASCTIAADPGSAPTGSYGDAFFYY